MLVSEDQTIKICDFYNAFLRHSSIHFKTRAHSYFSPRWAVRAIYLNTRAGQFIPCAMFQAPELLDGVLESSEQADVWALGMVCMLVV